MICGLGMQPAYAETAEDTVMFLVSGIQDGTRLGEEGIVRRVANGIFQVGDVKTNTNVEIEISVKQKKPCEFEITGKNSDGNSMVAMTVDFNKPWEAGIGSGNIPYVKGANLICFTQGDKTGKCIDLFGLG